MGAPSSTTNPVAVLLLGMALAVAACSPEGGGEATTALPATPASSMPAPPATESPTTISSAPATAVSQEGYLFPPAPDVPGGPLDPELAADLDTLFGSLQTEIPPGLIASIGRTGDARVAWLLSDLMRFIGGSTGAELIVAFEELTGVDIADDPSSLRSPWQSVTNHLLAWDVPAPPGYVEWKRIPFEIVEPRWEPFFADTGAEIDWRYVSWGGVLIDDRPLGDDQPCLRGCIPALDDPAVTPAAEGAWYGDDRIVFGVVVNGEARAYPKNQMEVHEMVNDTIGGRRLAIPYCTLCGSAQAYFTDDVPGHDEPLVFRTSGLLSRSNKVMYELGSQSVFDTFTGRAVSGPLLAEGVQLQQVSVVTSTWGEWRAAHPNTTIVAEDGGIGRRYLADPLQGRDDDGPIFPIGAVDDRLDVQTQVLGVVAPDGTPVAFDVAAALDAIGAGETVASNGIVVMRDGGGIRATTADGEELVGHQAFWFAWSQFNPDTVVWMR